jgi:hypothetical protein
LLQKKIHQNFLGIKIGLVGFFFPKNITDNEELGLTFSRKFCILELNVEKVGESSNCDVVFPP